MRTTWEQFHGAAFRGCRVLVTGGAGFIGSHLAQALVELGADVIVLDDLSGGSRSNIESLPVEFIHASILDRKALDSCVRRCRYLFHEAALGSVLRSIEQPGRYHEINIGGTLSVLESARQAGVGRVIFAGSSSVYGDNSLPWVETMAVRPRSPYAATKVAGEALLRAYDASYGLDTVSLRYFNVFGPRQNGNSSYAAVIAAFAMQILSGEDPIVHGDGEQSRDFTYIDNVVHANLLAARHARPHQGGLFNVGCGHRVSVNELIQLVRQFLCCSGARPVHRPERSGDVKHSAADLRRSHEVLGYQPIVNFSTGLQITLDWYRSMRERLSSTIAA